MVYHEHELRFCGLEGCRVVSGSYVVSALSVSASQDPDGVNREGMVIAFSGSVLRFRAGRRASSHVAAWFSRAVGASRTTFQSAPHALHFALLGTLELRLTGGLLGSSEQSFTFTGVALAQGHVGLRNNWWFGTQNALAAGQSRVRAEGTDSAGSPVHFVFQRGGGLLRGNAVNEVAVVPCLLDTATWMRLLPDNTPLDCLTMPGSHDAGMSEAHRCFPPLPLTSAFVLTQASSMSQQLRQGSRYFDIRIDYDHGQLVTYHRTGMFGCNGQELSEVFDQVTAFLHACPSETAILKLSHIRSFPGHDPADIKGKVNDVVATHGASLYCSAAAADNLARTPLGQLRGKLVLVCDYDDYVRPLAGRFRYRDMPLKSRSKATAHLVVVDRWSNTGDVNTMRTDQLAKWGSHATYGAGHLFLLSWTLTSTAPPFTPGNRQLAARANAQLPGVLAEQISVLNWARPNVVLVDYLDDNIAQRIIRYNL